MAERTIGIDRIENLVSVFGSFDENLHILESELGVHITDRDSELHIVGEEWPVSCAEQALTGLLALASRGEPITTQNTGIKYYVVQYKSKSAPASDYVTITTTDTATLPVSTTRISSMSRSRRRARDPISRSTGRARKN